MTSWERAWRLTAVKLIREEQAQEQGFKASQESPHQGFKSSPQLTLTMLSREDLRVGDQGILVLKSTSG